jgi:hypothetical protein
MRETEFGDPGVRAFLERMAREAPLEPVGVAAAIRRARRRVAVTWLGLAFVAALVVGGAAVAWDRADDAYVPRPAEPPAFTSPELQGLVLATEEDVDHALDGRAIARRLRAFPSREARPHLLSSRVSLDTEALRGAGLQEAYIGWFGTPGFTPTSGGTDLISLVLRFPDTASADRGLDVIRADGEDDWRIFRPTSMDQRGEEGWVADGRLWGKPTLAIVWRRGNAVFFLASQGHFTLQEFRTLANEVDRRAVAAE